MRICSWRWSLINGPGDERAVFLENRRDIVPPANRSHPAPGRVLRLGDVPGGVDGEVTINRWATARGFFGIFRKTNESFWGFYQFWKKLTNHFGFFPRSGEKPKILALHESMVPDAAQNPVGEWCADPLFFMQKTISPSLSHRSLYPLRYNHAFEVSLSSDGDNLVFSMKISVIFETAV